MPTEQKAGTQTNKKTAKSRQDARNKGVFNGFAGIQAVLTGVEKQLNQAVKSITKQNNISKKDLQKSLKEISKKFNAQKLLTQAGKTKNGLETEMKRILEDVFGTIKELEGMISQTNFKGAVKNAKKNVGSFVELISDNGVLAQVKKSIKSTRKELLGLLSIPTQYDVEKLEKKIVALERRLGNLSRKAA